MATVDDSELVQLIVDLESAPADLARGVRPVMSKAGLAIKQQMQSEAKASRHFRFAHTISYEMRGSGANVDVEVGPTRGGAGSLAGIAYFGGVRGGGGTIPDPRGALDAEAPNVEKHLLDLASKAFE